MSRNNAPWSARDLDVIVRFLDAVAGELWSDHTDAILTFREAARTRSTRRSRRQNRANDQLSADRDDR